jgi:uncharacterized protein (DUF58 family)
MGLDTSESTVSKETARERRIKGLEIKAKRLSQKRLLGRYRSRFKGRGIEFRDFREYLAGDDPRTIDWNVTARFGRPFVKNSEEERELSVVLLLDMSASQKFGSGTQTKLELAQQLTSLLALTALASGDKVGLLAFDDHHHTYLKPTKGRNQKQRLLQTIWQQFPRKLGSRQGSLAQSMEDLDRWLVGRGFLCLITDFLKPALLEPEHPKELERLLAAMRKLSYRHEVLALRTYDRRERFIPAVGQVVLRDLSDDRTIRVDTNHAHWKSEFGKRWALWHETLEGVMRRAQWEWAEFPTDVDPLPALISFLDARVRRR